jgi:uncharacterized protein YtpQ (UPF0354 family)
MAANLLSQEAFAKRVEQATRDAQIAVERREGLLLYVSVHGESQRLNLQTAWQAYQNAPTRLTDIIAAHINVVKRLVQIQPTLDQGEIRHVLPVIQRTAWLTETQRQGITPVHRPLVTGLVVTYVFDLPSHRAYVNTGMLATQLGHISPDALHDHALDNFRRQLPNDGVKFMGAGKQQLIVCETRDGYATSLLLLPEMMTRWAERLIGPMLVGLPNRDFLIAFSEQHPDRTALARQIKADARARQNALSQYLLAWKEGKVREYQPLH